VRESRRTSAKTALLDLAGREERYFSTNNIYSSDQINQLGYAQSPVPVPDATSDYYLLKVAASPDGSGFLAISAPQNDQQQDGCGSFTLTNTGVRGVTGNTVPIDQCWN